MFCLDTPEHPLYEALEQTTPMPKKINSRSKKENMTRKNMPGEHSPFQILILNRRTELDMSLRDLHRKLVLTLGQDEAPPLSTFWEWCNRKSRRIINTTEKVLKAIASAIEVPFEEFIKQWELSKLEYHPSKIPTPEAHRSAISLLIQTLENDKRIFVKRAYVLELAKRLHGHEESPK